MMSRMPRACCRASPVHMPTASKTQRSSVVDVLDMFSNSQGAPHKVTKAWNGKVSKSHAEPYGKVIFIKIGSFQMPKTSIRCRIHWGQVIWMGCSTSAIFDRQWNVNLSTSTLCKHCKHCKHSTLGSPHPMPEKFSSCNLPSITYNTWQMAVLPTLMLHVWCYKYEKFITPRQDIQIVNQVSALLYCTLVFVSAFLQSLPSQDPRHQPCWLPGPPEPSDVSTVLFLSSTPYVESMETETLLRPTSCFVSQQNHMSQNQWKHDE